MATATARTAKFGGAAATFTTAASPGAALSTLFSAADTALTSAGWTSIYSTTNAALYSSNGESGTETMFLRLATGAMGTATGGDISGGSYLVCGLCQYADASGNYYNCFGAPKLQNSDLAANTCLELEPSLTWDYVIVADKNGITIAALPTTSHANQPYWIHTGLLSRSAGINTTNLVTSSTIAQAGGTGITVNVTTNPIAAGYVVGDGVMVCAQGGTGGANHLADLFSTRIIGLTTSSVTLEVVPSLSQTMAAGALIGADPQPFHGTARTTTSSFGAVYNNTVGGAKLFPVPYIGMNTNTNQWTAQLSTTIGDQIGDSASVWDVAPYSLNGTFATTIRPEGRTNAWWVDTGGGRNSSSASTLYRGKSLGRVYVSGRNGLPGTLAVEFAKLRPIPASAVEYVGFSSATMGIEVWMGPFPVLNTATKRLTIVNSEVQAGIAYEVGTVPGWVTQTSDGYDETRKYEQGPQAWAQTPEQNDTQTAPVIQGSMLDIAASSDDIEVVPIDQPYPFDYTYKPSSQENSGFNRGFN
jgi:hypothetical protein